MDSCTNSCANSRSNSWTNFSRISCTNLSAKFVRIRMIFFARKIGYVTNGLYCISKVTIIQFCHPSRQTTHARQLCVIIVPSEALNEWSPHHPHPLLTNQHENADVGFIISDPIYQKSRGCGLQNCHPFLGVAIT